MDMSARLPNSAQTSRPWRVHEITGGLGVDAAIEAVGVPETFELCTAMVRTGGTSPLALAACTVNAAHVLACADRKGRIAPGYDADLVLLEADDWRYLAYHLGGDVVASQG